MVPTPFDCENNEVDLSSVEESLKKLNDMQYKGIVLIKSTVPPGSCDSFSTKFNLKIVFNPEFLRESTTPNEDFENQDTIVIGTESTKILIWSEKCIRSCSFSCKILSNFSVES